MRRRYEPNLALRRLRNKEGISCMKLSFELGFSKSKNIVRLYESGHYRAPLNIRSALAERYGGTERNYRQRPLEIKKINSNTIFCRVNHRLREKIYGAGLTLAEVCEIRGVDISALQQYVSKGVPVGKRVAIEIAYIIGCSVEDLMGFEGEGGLNKRDGMKRISYSDSRFSFEKWEDERKNGIGDTWPVVRVAMGYLSGNDRDMLERKFGICGEVESSVKIAEREGVEDSTIRMRQARAMRNLRNILYEKFADSLPAHGAEFLA